MKEFNDKIKSMESEMPSSSDTYEDMLNDSESYIENINKLLAEFKKTRSPEKFAELKNATDEAVHKALLKEIAYSDELKDLVKQVAEFEE